MKFVADEMLGKLARWLRFMGLDVVHQRPFPDEELMEFARREGRILLTRDRRIIESRSDDLDVHAVTEDLPFDQMVELVRHFNLDPLEHAFTRCAECNHALIERSREEVTGKVPPFVYANVQEYRECTGCGKFYWAGTHRARIERILTEVKNEASKDG